MKTLFHIDDLADDSCLEIDIDGEACFAVRKDGQIHLYRNQCPHLGVALNWQENQFLDPDAALIQCATHGALFVIQDGRCVAGPCLGARLTAIDFTIEDDRVKAEHS